MNGPDLLLRGGVVLDPGSPLRTADVRIRGDRIVDVGPALSARGAEVVEVEDRIVMPGLINAHTHSGQHLDRGMAPNLPLDLWLIWVVYGGPPFSPDDSYTLALAGALEMLESGCTAVLDHAWLAPDAFADHAAAIMTAYEDVGIRAGLAPMVQDLDIVASMSFDGAGVDAPPPLGDPLPAAHVVDWMTAFLDEYTNAHARLVPMVGPSAPQRCSDELMAGLAELSTVRSVPFHTHVLETKAQVFATQERYGGSVVAFLDDLGLLGGQSSLAHGIWMTADDYDLIRERGATIVHNPVSNLRCGSGLLPVADLLDQGVALALGADGGASNDTQNMFEAMKVAGLIHTLYGPFQRWPGAERIWQLCLDGGARALGQDLGRVAPGALADLVVLDAARHVGLRRGDLVASLVLAEHGDAVETVIVGGDVVVREGRSVTVDRADVLRRSRELQLRIHAAREEREAVYDRYVEPLTAAHEHAMATPCGLERLAVVSPAFGTPP